MTDKTQSQLKRSVASLNQQQQQPLEINSNFQDLIQKIQQTIVVTSESMKQSIIKFQQKQLINFKQDLFKTQDEFIKLKAQRNQQVIKNNIMKQKTQVQEKFNTKMKKSIEMNAQYQEMKNLMEKMSEQENQLELQIQYIKRKIQKQKYQGKCLQFQINQLQSQKKQENPKTFSKIDHQMKLFTELANKCDPKKSNHKKIIKQVKQSTQKPVTPPQNLNKKTEKKLKEKIQNLKQYIENIPLDLNFMESKIYAAIQRRKDKKKAELQNQKSSILESEQEQDKIIEDSQNLSTLQSNANSLSINGSKQFKLPILKQKGNKALKMSKSTNHLLKCTPKYTYKKDLDWNFSSAGKTRTQKSCDGLKLDEKILLLEYLPRSSELLQEILLDPEVKQYLFKLMFN